MSFVKFGENGYLLDRHGDPMYLVGINYSPRGTHGCFWKETWDPAALTRDLDQIQALGLNCIRFPVHWYAFEPEEGKMDPAMLERLDWFMAECGKRELYMQPWFLVGCANGMFDVPWRCGRSFIYDESMIRAEENHLAVFAARYRENPHILAWDICDEPEWFSRMDPGSSLPYDRERFTQWTRRMYASLKTADENHLVTLGVGHFITGHYGMDSRDLAESLDVMSITNYYGSHGIDKARSGFEYEWNTDMNRFGRPVYLSEAPGHTDCENFTEEVCGNYESVIYGTWLHGSVGTMPWQFSGCPEALWTSSNMDEYMSPAGYGIVDGEGNVKPQGLLLSEIAASMKRICAPQYALRKPEVALLVPEAYHTHVDACYPALRDTYAALNAADIPVETVWATDNYERYPFLVISATHSSPVIPLMVGGSYTESVGQFRNSGYLRLIRYVENGGNLLFLPHMQAASPAFPKLFGAAFGSVQRLWEDRTVTFEKPVGVFGAGDSFVLDFVHGNDYRQLAPREAEVLATIDGGRPFIIRNRLGKGQVVYVAADIFSGFYRMSPRAWDTSPLFDLMAGLMELLGAKRPVTCADPNVECGILESTQAEQFLVLAINRNDSPCDVPVIIRNMAAFRPENQFGDPIACAVRGADLVIHGPLAPRKATLIVLKK